MCYLFLVSRNDNSELHIDKYAQRGQCGQQLKPINIFAEHFPDLKLADRYVIAAMALAREAHPASLTDRQVIVKPAELPTIRGETTAQLYWSTVFVKAGMKSRRTTGALLLGPGAPTVCGHPLLKAFWSALAGR